MKAVKKGWYHGWNIVIAASIISLITTGIRMSIGPFFLPILNDFEMSRTTLSMIVSVGMFTFGIGMPLAGMMESRFGPKVVLFIGVFMNLVATIWMVTTQTILGLFLSFGIFISIGLALASQVTLTPTITRWFVRKRGQALFYLSTGGMAGIAIMNPVSNQLIAMFDWKVTMLMFAIGLVILVIPLIVFVIHTNVPENADQLQEDLAKEVKKTESVETDKALSLRESLQTSTFWYICIGLFACGFSMNLIGSHGVPMLVDHGFSSVTASNAIGVIGLVAIPGTIIMASFSDKVSKKGLLALIYITRGVGIICLVWVMVTYQLYLVALVAGVAWAGNTALSSAILSNVYGVRLVGVLYGFAFFVHQIGATISTFLGGWAYDKFNTHLVAFLSAGIILFIAGVFSLRVVESHVEFKDRKMPVASKVSG